MCNVVILVFFEQKTAYELRISDWSSDVCSSDLVLIRVAAAGVNRPDVLQRQGSYPPPPGASEIPGLEVAGTVAAVGPGLSTGGVTAPKVSDEVCALVTGGGYAEYCLAPAPQCLDRKSTRLNSSHYCATRMPPAAGKKKK